MSVLSFDAFRKQREQEEQRAAAAKAPSTPAVSAAPERTGAAASNYGRYEASMNRDETLTYDQFRRAREQGIAIPTRNMPAVRADIEKTQAEALPSVLAYGADGRLDPSQTLLNLAQNAKEYKAAVDKLPKATMPKTAEEAKTQAGIDYELEEMPILSRLLGHTVYKPARGTTLGEIHGLGKDASVGDAIQQSAKNSYTGLQNVKDRLSNAAAGNVKTGNETVDNWGKTLRVGTDAARKLSQVYGIPTAAIEGSQTRENMEAFQQRNAEKSFGQKLGSNIGITAADYALSMVNAGLTGADALSGGRLGETSIFQMANFAQNAGSGLTAEAYNSMREGTNWLGRLVLDLEKTGLEQILDRTIGGGAGGLVPMGIRVFGSGAQESENRGESLSKQVWTGGARGLVELGTEMLGGVGGSWRGTGYGDAFLNKVDKWIASKTGSEFLGTLANAFTGEALEEMIADVLNPVMDRILGIGEVTGRGTDKTFMQKLGSFLSDVWGDGQILYDGLLGGLAGMGGGGVAQIQYGAGARNLAVDIATYKAAQRIASSNSMRQKFTDLTGVKLSTDKNEALRQAAVYLTNVSDSTEGNPNAREVETNLFRQNDTGSEQRSAELAEKFLKTSDVTTRLDMAFAGMDLNNSDREILADGYIPSQGSLTDYAIGVREAYRMGSQGWTYEQARQHAEYGDKLQETQFRHAWQLGANVQTAQERSVDVSTEEGKTALEASLASLGAYSEEAASVYEAGQDVNTFGAAMAKAATLYSVGADVDNIVRQAKLGYAVDNMAKLTDAQVAKAKQIGEKLRADKVKAAEAKETLLRELRENAKGKGPVPGKVTIETTAGKVGGVSYTAVDTGKLSDTQQGVVRLADAIARYSGLDIRVVDFGKGYGGEYLPGAGGKLYLNINASWNGENIAAGSLTHEVTHFLQEYAPKRYTELKRIVMDEMSKNPEAFADILGARSGAQPDLTVEGVTDEMVANACQTIFMDPEAVQRIASTNQSFFEKLRDWVLKVIDDLKAAFAEFHTDSSFPLMKEVKAAEGALDQMREAWLNAFSEASENLQAEKAAGTRNAAPKGGAQQQAWNATEFGQTVQNWFDNNTAEQRKKDTGVFQVGTISEPLKSIGVRDGLLIWGRGKVQKILDDHAGEGIDIDVIKQVPDITERPVFVLKSKTVKNSLVLFGTVKTKTGRNMLATVSLTPGIGKNLDVDLTVITGAYSRRNNQIQNMLQSSEILYVDGSDNNNRTNEWLKQIGLQLPSRTTNVGPIGSIAYTPNGVNISGKMWDQLYSETDEETGSAPTEVGSYDLKDFEAAKGPDGKPLFQIYAFEHDEPEYREMLAKWGGLKPKEIDELFRTVDMAMAKIKANLEALDFAWEEDINDRAFQPIKQNSDKLYKVSQDFSTLCRKRLLQGLIAGHLSAALQRGLTKEEGIAVRDALLAIQEEGKQIEVACALCYVESARMRSQKAIQEFLNDREGALRNYYANQKGRDAVARAEAAERQAIYEEYGLVRGKGDDATMYDIRDTKTAKMSKIPTNLKKRIQDAKKAARNGYALTAEQQKTVDYANSLPVEAFTTPEGLQELAKSKYRDVFNAFVLKVSAASKSKGIENDTWWRAGDSKGVGDALIEQMNAENGLRTQSWSDFTVKHLMDYIAATIEMSTRGAKQHAYTKVIDYVELMGRTGVMINMSLIPTRVFNGKLEYDDVEGFKYKEALRLREKFPDTAGTICIGMEVEQIRQLLESVVIDYVIPYHQSGMSKDTRKAMHIPAWKDFQNFQGEKQLKGQAAEANARKYGVKLLSESDPHWHEGPNFSDWFDLKRARQIAKEAGKSGKYGVMTGGYAAMQDAAEKYKRICAERGLMPKFSYGDADFSNDPNYWKLLIDRKMVNNKTGEIIEQKTLKPVFDFDTVERILNDELKRYGTVKADQEEAIERVTRAFLTGDVKGGMSSEQIAKVMQKPVDNISITNITQNAPQLQAFDEQAVQNVAEAAREDNAPAVAEQMVQYSLWEGEPPKKTQYGFKLMTVTKVGDKWLPTAMFIDRANPYEFGVWYKADSPKMANLVNLEPGYSYLIDENDNADMATRRPFKKTTRVNKKGQKQTSYSQLPSVGEIDQATRDGKRWMLIDRYADGGVNIQNLGVNGSGTVSKFALRPGIHAVDIPSMAHIGAVDKENGGKKRRTNERWFLIEYPVDNDYNQEAYSHESKDIRDHLPTGGWYSYQTNSGAEARQHWFITGGMRIVGAVSEADVRKYAKDRGFEQDLQWKDGKVYSEDDAIDMEEYLRTTTAMPTPSKDEMRQRIESGRPQLQAWDDGPVYNNRALVSEETIDKWLTGGWFGSNTNPNYAQAYIAYMTPAQYLRLSTIYDEGRIRQESDGRTMEWVKETSEGQPIQLKIDAKEGKVYDHEGRHRMVVLDRSGVRHVPVLLFDMDTKYSKEPLAELKLEGQNFNGMRNYATTIIQDLVPLNRAHREEILEKFSKKTSFEKISEKYDRYTTFQFQRWDTTNDDTATERNGRELAYARIQNENAILRETVKSLRKSKTKLANLQKQLQLTKTPETRLSDARKLAKTIISENGSEADTGKVAGDIKALGDYLLQTEPSEIREETLKARARAIAHEVLESATQDVTFDEETLEVNPYEAYMGEATEELANRLVMDAMSGMLRATPPTRADKQRARTQELKDHIKQLRDEQKLSQKEAASLYQTIYELSVQLDKAESRYATLQTEAEYRTAQVRAEGAARAAEIRANERARAEGLLKAQKEHYLDIAKRAKERRNESAGVTKYRKQVEQKAKKLYELLLTNSNDLHVPEVLKGPLGEFLESLDFTSKRQLAGGAETQADRKFGARLLRLQQMLQNQQSYINGDGNVQQDLGGYIDVSSEILDYLRNMAEMITTAMNTGRTFTVNQMSAEDLKVMSQFLSNLKTAITNMNHFMANARYETVREAASQDIEDMKKMGKAKALDNSGVAAFAMWQNGTPYYVMKRLGEGARAIFDGLTRGWEKMAVNGKEIIDFAEKAYTTKEVNEWKNKVRDITLEDGSKIRMTTAQIMELSMLLGREQAVRHISRGGIRIGDIKFKGKAGKIADTQHYHLTDGDIRTITGMLTPRQMAVAKALQKYMAVKGAEWGNEISMRRFGYNFYEEGPGYYPIKTDSNDRPMADTDLQTNSMFRLLNLSSSKSLNPKASNALIVGDIFDTFADHMSDMAKLNGMGLPILDAIKWFNFKEKVDRGDGTYDTRTLQGAMEQAFGEQAGRYFRTLMKDINGQTESGDRGMGLANWVISRYKAQAVGANLRVALLQPTSYVRALTVVKPQYLLGAFGHKNAYQEAMKYSGTAVWKSLGFYETDMARSMRSQIQHDEGLRDKLVEASMKLAELGDRVTWGRLWVACKMQTKAENPSLSGEALNQKTADLFREAIYSSQVMDSTLTRSEIMRSKGVYSKISSAFMAEPTLSYNILLDAASQLNVDERKYGKAEAWKRNSSKVGKAFIVYVNSAAVAAVIESLADAIRDDDDEPYWDKFLQALLGDNGPLSGNLAQDLTIIGKMPYLKDFMSTLQGYKSGNIALSGFISIVDAAKIWKETYDLSTGALEKPTKITSYGKMTPWGKIYKTLQALSQIGGLPVSGLTRDVVAIWNTLMNGRMDDWKIKTYEDSNEEKAANLVKAIETGDEEKIQKRMEAFDSEKDAATAVKSYLKGQYNDEQISEEHATALLARLGIEGNDAYWTIRNWEGEDKYTEIKASVLAGDKVTVQSEIKQLTEHGVKEKDVISSIKTFVKKVYLGTELSEKEAEIVGDTKLSSADARKILAYYAGLDTDKAVETVAGWDFKKQYGFELSDRKEAYMDGTITSQQLHTILIHDVGKSAEDAEGIIKSYDFEKQHGWAWGDRKEMYQKGNVSRREMVSLLQSYGGKTAQEAENQVSVWEWAKDIPGAEDITVSAIEKYNTYCAGVDKAVFVKAWKGYNDTKPDYDANGDSIAYSKTVKVMPQINALPISAAEKTAIALCFWSQSTVNKYRLW